MCPLTRNPFFIDFKWKKQILGIHCKAQSPYSRFTDVSFSDFSASERKLVDVIIRPETSMEIMAPLRE